ncbi:acyl-CoA thioesterase [Paenibacillus shunpengii]|uniref:Acyl-CoA thioesterase n=1 Tax=Paenibacillus shunpengii TaxID=2054424 RepID=A0ABW5SJA6_9BACL|nr:MULTISPECIES: thioesterase family protein [unclassified Paenibacillus]OMC71300.1 thioesterase [Paenibacillus sp. FSL H7-0326]SDW25774.1 acyl-CoA thioester hydrolase [Paenibacillus sp. PDC88]
MKAQQIERTAWYGTRFRVRYQESDQMGVVYHANYVNWFEIGRTEMIRTLGFSYRSMEEQGVLLPVIGLDLKYKLPAKYDDYITVWTRINNFSSIRLHYEYEVRREERDAEVQTQPDNREVVSNTEDLPGELLVTGSTQHVWVNADFKPVRLDKCVPNLYDALKRALSVGRE